MKIKHESDHRKRRSEEYPSIEEQMDSIWHAMDQGMIPKIEPMYSRIKAVKDKYPKRFQGDLNS
jgi:hypothetical protein